LDRVPLTIVRPGRAVALALLLLAAAWLRLSGLDWDQGQHLHPDERFLTMVATDIRWPRSLAAYFDTGHSPLNPADVGRGYISEPHCMYRLTEEAYADDLGAGAGHPQTS
jgi:hypothetical protein